VEVKKKKPPIINTGGIVCSILLKEKFSKDETHHSYKRASLTSNHKAA
jgi:hypothetical protein